MPTDEQVAELERRVDRLEQLVSALYKRLGVREENPTDRRAVTSKEQFDWQR